MEPDAHDSSGRGRVKDFLDILSASPKDEDFTVTNSDILWTAVSIFGRFISVLLTINLAIDYYLRGQHNYFVWTLCCFLIPMIITIFLQCTIYYQDKDSIRNPKKIHACRLIWAILISPVLFRYCQSFNYALASKRAENRNDKLEQKRYYELLIHEDSDVALVRIFECFLEAAPQKILQISIILSGEEKISVAQTLAILSAMFSMAWCIASYHRCIRLSQVDKVNLSWWGSIFQTFWYFLVTVSRVLSIAIISSLFPIWTLISFSIHALVMSLWIFIYDRSPFCSQTIVHSLFFSAILGFVFIFNYILTKARNTRYRYAVYYVICFAENLLCATLFKIYSSSNAIYSEYFPLLLTLSIMPFLLGIICMIIYYKAYHPNVMARKDIARQNTTTNT